MKSSLSPRESQILALNAACMTPDEIADRLSLSAHTVRKTISNIKIKTGLQKAIELVTLYFSLELGKSLEDIKREIIASALLAIVLFTIVPTNNDDYLRANRSPRTRTTRTTRSGRRSREGEPILDFNEI